VLGQKVGKFLSLEHGDGCQFHARPNREGEKAVLVKRAFQIEVWKSGMGQSFRKYMGGRAVPLSTSQGTK
jgi:hypothetical protein